MGAERRPVNHGGVEGARPYGVAGVVPADAVTTTYRPHGNGRLHVSDTPFVQPYAERPTCQGTRTDGKACGAKAQPGGTHCSAHDPSQ